MEIVRRFFTEPAGSFFLFGPRGTGKSTWLRQNYPDALYIDMLDPETYRDYLSHPERIYEVVRASPQTKQVVIDEVQEIPEILDEERNLWKLMESCVCQSLNSCEI